MQHLPSAPLCYAQLMSAAANSYVLSLIRAIERGPRRPALEKYLAFYLDMEAPLHVHALLAAWARHTVPMLRVGAFLMNDRAIQTSFELPIWVKDGRGPHADVEVDDEQVRSDVIVLGTWHRERQNEIVGIRREGRTIHDRVISICGPHDTTRSTLDLFLHHCHEYADGMSDIHPDGEPARS